MKKWDTVAIVGVGLLGGSIGLALQQRKLARRVVGIGRRTSSLRKAEQCTAVTTTTTHLARGVADADLVIVCTPVGNIVDHVCEVAADIAPAWRLITDVGSTKAEHRAAAAGATRARTCDLSAATRWPAARRPARKMPRPTCLQDRVTVVTPTPASDPTCVDRIERVLAVAGLARACACRPRHTTRPVAMTSHVAHVVAAALAVATSDDGLPVGCQRLERHHAHCGRRSATVAADPVDQSRPGLEVAGQVWESALAVSRRSWNAATKRSFVQLLDAGKKTRDSVGS